MNQKRQSNEEEQGEKKPKTEKTLPLKFKPNCSCQQNAHCDECKNTNRLFLVLGGFGLAALGILNPNKKIYL